MVPDDSSDDKRPSKRRRTRKKKQSAEDELDDQYKKKITEAIEKNLEEYAKRRSLSQKQVSSIIGFVEEHLSCFLLIGYTFEGEPLTILNAPTSKDADSIAHLVQKFVSRYSDPQTPPRA